MKSPKLKFYSECLAVLAFISVKSMAMSHHGGGEHQSAHPKQPEQTGEQLPVKASVITIISPPTVEVSATIVCPGEYLYRNKKGFWHGDKKCRNLAVLIEKIDGCEKSDVDCPFAGKLYYILSSEQGDKLAANNRLKNKKIKINGKLYEAERAIEIIEFSKQ